MPAHVLDSYEFGPTLGKGAFGEVRVAVNIYTGQEVAIKIVDKSTMVSDVDRQQLQEEVRITRLLDHKNVVKLYDVIDDERYMYIVQELVEGNELHRYICKYGRPAEYEARIVFQQVIEGLDHVHQHNIVHRDIKVENILFDRYRQVKIVDFGLATEFDEDRPLTRGCGTLEYAAPEMLSRDGVEYKGPEVDIWSCGVVLFALLTGHLPFPGSSPKEIRASIAAGRYTIPDFVSDPARDLLMRMLCLDRHARITMHDIQSHAWVTGVDNAHVCNDEAEADAPKVLVGSGSAAPRKLLLSTAFVLRELGKDNSGSDSCVALQKHSKGLSTVRKIRSKVAAFDHHAIVQKVFPAASFVTKSLGPLSQNADLLSTAFVWRELGLPPKKSRKSCGCDANTFGGGCPRGNRLRFRAACPSESAHN